MHETRERCTLGGQNPMPNTPLFFEDLNPGDEWTSPSRLITQELVMQFAELTGDMDPLHVDPDFAAKSPYRQPIAHGLLGLSFMAGLSSHFPYVRTSAFLGLKEWSFDKPIFMGDSVHVVTIVAETRNHGRRHGEVIWRRKVLNQLDQIVQQGMLVTLVSRQQILRSDAAHLNNHSVGLSTFSSDVSLF